MAVVTITSQPGCPGIELAARLAGRIGFSLVDKTTFAQLSGEIDLDEARLRKVDEAILKGDLHIDPETEACVRLLQDLIAQLAEERDLVIIDRSAQGLFRNRPGTLHVRLVAPRKFRVRQVRTREGLSGREAGRLVGALEKEHARYLRFLYRLNPADPDLYDLTLRMDRLSIDQALTLMATAVDGMDLLQVPRDRIVKDLLPQVPEKRDTGRFANTAETEFARFLRFYRIPFEYESRTFNLETDANGRIVEAFTPDFYLPEQDLYIELTTMKQSLVTRKNRKVRKLRRLYPEVNIRIFYQRDFHNLMAKYGLLGSPEKSHPGFGRDEEVKSKRK
ncbi:MAG TPA: cytidylate kinase family protein [Syntrophobacteraceae bacterium]|nr:cytidylate kinase family protein [Syntrophobacteraceae bacterium]